MRASQMKRHLGALDQAGKTRLRATTAPLFATSRAVVPDELENLEFSPRDNVSFLLAVDAEIEHCLMVQYLYAAYSLGGPQVPSAYRDQVRGWQEVILGIAKEEMGHLITVQNVLRVIGAPLHMEREDYPWDVPFYPFPFMLQPLTLDALAKYVYAEAPVDWDGGAIGEDIRRRVKAQTASPHHVAELFNKLIPLVKDPDYLPDNVFQADTYPCQASWEEWGRGYQGGSRGNSTGANPAASPDVLVIPVASRDNAVSALQQIAEQGEATHAINGDTPSHFTRFLKIYTEMVAIPDLGTPQGWSPSRSVAVNPYVSLDRDIDPAEGLALATPVSLITHPEAALWAMLHNLRYRMLLTCLIHTFTLYGGLTVAGLRTPRGAIVNATFGEMYNLRALSEILMQLPLAADQPDARKAGPPFQMPYTLDSPFGEANRWRLYLDLLTAADRLIATLLNIVPPVRHPYLQAMRESDQQMIQTATRILSGNIDPALI